MVLGKSCFLTENETLLSLASPEKRLVFVCIHSWQPDLHTKNDRIFFQVSRRKISW